MASRRPSEALSVAFLNSLMPWPRPLASSGNFFAPNKIKTIARIKMISPPPTLNRPNMMLIEKLLCYDGCGGANEALTPSESVGRRSGPEHPHL